MEKMPETTVEVYTDFRNEMRIILQQEDNIAMILSSSDIYKAALEGKVKFEQYHYDNFDNIS